MIQSRRRRRRSNLSPVSPVRFLLGARWSGVLIIFLLIAGVFWYGLRSFTPSVSGSRVATQLSVEGRDDVYVVIDEREQRAESGLRLYEGDVVKTGGGSASARLDFFDGTYIVLDGRSAIRLGDVIQGEEASLLSLTLLEGQLWIATGTGDTVQRYIETSLASHRLTPELLAIAADIGDGIADERLHVFDSSGPGISSTIRGSGALSSPL